MLIQEVTHAASGSLAGTAAEWLWLVPVLPLLGFVINGGLSLLAATTMGPADPSAGHAAPGHDAAGHDAHHAHDPAAGGAHGDDHHPVVRHRYAGAASIVGPAVLLLSFILSVAIFLAYKASGSHDPFVQRYFTWMVAGDLTIEMALMVDQLSLVMLLVVTGVGTLIHVFSVGYMRDDPGYPRYFAYLNLFVFFM